MNISADNKIIAKTLANTLGINPSVHRYRDDNDSLDLALFSCADPIDSKVRFYGTVGLSDYPTFQDGKEFPTRVEILGAAYSEEKYFPNILATIAFHSIREKFFCSPDSVLENAVLMYDAQATLPHVLFSPPYLWEDKLRTLKFENKTVAWVLAIPISEKELQYREKNGTQALEELLEKNEANIFDLHRKSVV